MIRRSVLVLPLVVASLAVVACSSSSSTTTSSSTATLGGANKAKTCKNTSLNHTRTAQDDACDQCDAEKCASEGTTAIGSDPNAFGGACGSYIGCICDCDKSDIACLTKCGSPSQACSDALNAAKQCEQSKCSAQCVQSDTKTDAG